jgi:integrase
MRKLKQFLKQDGLIFRSKRGGPLVENSILVRGLHPALKNLGLPKAGMHAFRRGCNRRWELARVSAAVIRQQMGHASSSMTAHYTSEIPVEVVKNFRHIAPLQALPRNASNPSLAMMGTIMMPATRSAHHSPKRAFKSRPARRIAER